MSNTSPDAAFSCPICARGYGRVDHLQRHLSTHTTTRPFTCTQCGQAYRRRDVLRRHYSNCKFTPRAAKILSKPATRQSSRRACDRCVRQKRRCSNSIPCLNCVAQKQPCTYPLHIVNQQPQPGAPVAEARSKATEFAGLQHHQPSSLLSTGEVDGLYESHSLTENHSYSQLSQCEMIQESLPSDEHNMQEQADFPLDPTLQDFWLSALDEDSPLIKCRDPALHFHFLVGFAKNQGLAETFEIGECTPSFQPTSFAHQDSGLPGSSNNRRDLSEVTLNDVPQNVQDCMTRTVQHAGDATLLASCDDPLLMRTVEICKGIRNTVVSHASDAVLSIEWSPLTEAMVQQFFSPCNLRRFLQLYWKLWHPQWPCIHKATFQYHKTPSTLLTPLALIGASLSPKRQDRQNACIWFDVVEEWVFGDSYVSAVTMGREGDDGSRKDINTKMKLLQATYAVCIYQLWQGEQSAKNRVRRYRFNALVGIIRDIGPAKARHSYPTDTVIREDRFDWNEFARSEELIRLMMFVFILDTGFTTWYNYPPRLVLRELQFGLPYPESCFHAETASECVEKINAWRPWFPQQSDDTLYSLICAFCKDKLAEDEQSRFPYASLMTLWAVVKAFYTMGFNLDVTLDPDIYSKRILNGIENWKVVWNRRFANADDDIFDVPLAENVAGTLRSSMFTSGQRPAFWRHAAEYWLLARIMFLRKASHDLRDQTRQDGLLGTSTDLACTLAPSPFDRYDQNVFPRLVEFLLGQNSLAARSQRP